MTHKPTYQELEQRVKEFEQVESELKLTIKELHDSEERFKALQDASFGGLIIHDNGIILECSLELSNITGYTKEELAGMDGFKLIAPDFLDQVLKNIKRAYDKSYEVEGIRKDGSIYPLAIRGKNVPYKGREVRVIEFRDITERKLAENELIRHRDHLEKLVEERTAELTDLNMALKGSEERFRCLSDASFEGIIISENGRIIETNDIFCKTIGYKPLELIGKAVIDHVPPKESENVKGKMLDGYELPYETSCLRKDGSIFPVEVHAKMFSYKGKQVRVKAIRDITERKKVEDTLRLHGEIMKNMAEGVYLIRLEDGIIVYANPRFEKMFGYEPGEMIGKDVSIVNAPTDEKTPQKTKQAIIDILVETGEWSGEVENIKKDGTRFWCKANVTLFDHHEFGKVFVSVHTDITEHKLAEAAQHDSEQKFRALFDQAGDHIIILEPCPDGPPVIIDANQSAIEKHGYSRDEFIGMPISSLDDEKNRELVAERTKRLLAGEHLVFETNHIRKDGSIFPVEVSSKMFMPKQGPPLFVSVERDITDRKQSEKVLKNAHDELEKAVRERTLDLQKTHEQLLHAEKMSAIGNLSASIAHEFNNPLQGVMGVIRGVKRRVELSKDDQQLVDMAITECNRMKDLIKSLQDFNRPTSSRKAPVNIHNSLDSILLLAKKQFQTRMITVEKKYAKNLPQIMAVGDQLKQVFLNLLNNASDACSQGSDITIETDRLENNVVIRIHDTGCGITAENKDRIFQPFFTTKAAMKGTGLGLSVSYGIIEDHGGKIMVESEPGKGTTFSVILPIEGNSSAE